MSDKTTTTREEKDSKGNKTETKTETERDESARRPANPSAPGQDSAKSGHGSDTNPSGIGGNEESVSG